MLRLLALGVCIIAIVGWFIFDVQTKSQITLSDARAYPIGARGEIFMVTLKMENAADAAEITGLSSALAKAVKVLNPGSSDMPLIVPAGSSAEFAMDGAHIMLRMKAEEFPEGGFIPLVVEFNGSQQVTTRVLNAGADRMDDMQHGVQDGVEMSPEPAISISTAALDKANGFDISIGLKNLGFVSVPEGTAHVPHEGHAHVFLNGLKLGRAYASEFKIGGLTPGDYHLRVGLNAHDHRPYIKDGQAIEDTFEFSIP